MLASVDTKQEGSQSATAERSSSENPSKQDAPSDSCRSPESPVSSARKFLDDFEKSEAFRSFTASQFDKVPETNPMSVKTLKHDIPPLALSNTISEQEPPSAR
jgi:hypothetical protein